MRRYTSIGLPLLLVLCFALAGCAELDTAATGDTGGTPIAATPTPPAAATPTPPAAATPTPRPAPAPSPTPAPRPTAGATPSATGNGCAITPAQTAEEQALLALLNQHRATTGALPLALDAALSAVSRMHSCDMLTHDRLSHSGSDGSTPGSRISGAGLTYSTGGENIGMAKGYALPAGVDEIDAAMMAEPLTPGSHRWNILNGGYLRVGIGILVAGAQVWLTEDFIG